MRKFLLKVIMCASITSMLVTGCANDDVYDPNASAKKYENAWKKNIGSIDPNQSWNSFTTVKVNVTINEDWGETYTIKLYTDNPLDKNSGAMLLAQSSIENGKSYSIELELPGNLSGIYVAKTNKNGECMVKYAQNVNGVISTFFGISMTRSYMGNAPFVEIEKKDCPIGNIEEMLIEAEELVPNASYNDSHENIYKVTSDKNYNQSLHAQEGQQEVYLIIANGAKLTMTSNAVQNVCIVVSDGTLHLEGTGNTFPMNSRLVVCAKGKVTGGYLHITDGSGGALNYNAGTIDIDNFNFNAAKFYNCGTIHIKSDMNSTSNNGHLINMGTVTVEGTTTITNSTLSNGCHMELKDLIRTTLELGDNSYLQVHGRFETSGTITLGKSAVLDVNEYVDNGSKVIAPSTNTSTNYSEYAFIKFAKITQWNHWSQQEVVFTGYYVIDAGEWAVAGDDPSNPYGNYATNFKKQVLGEGGHPDQYPVIASFTVTPPDTSDECSATVKIEGKEDEDKPFTATYAYEDLGDIGDYDFNDVVLQISHEAGSEEATVKLMALGGTLPVAVKYGSETLWEEAHAAFGESSNTFINTTDHKKESPEARTIKVSKNVKFNEIDLHIVVTGNNGEMTTITKPSTGKAPQRLCIPGEWQWPTERTSIIEAYATEGHTFGNWSSDSEQATDWYSHPVANKVW